MLKTTPHQAKYFAHAIACKSNSGGSEDLTEALMNAQVDLNPHQIEAALFALKHPLNEGVMLADEVGLGKTIEAGLVLCQLWAERKRRLLVVCPSSLRKQWQEELREKFALPATIAESRWPDIGDGIWVMSYQFAAKYAERVQLEHWDCAVLDEAHKLRNAHRERNRIGQALQRALAGTKKILLTATPLQNSLMELYGLSLFLDPYLFGSDKQFRRDFVSQSNVEELQSRLKSFVQRTLRRDVQEYVSYTERHALTQQFTPTDEEDALYQNISALLQREDSYALPRRQRHLTGLILRKLLASSPHAVLGTLEAIHKRLLHLQKGRDGAEQMPLFLNEDVYDSEDDWEESEEQPPEKIDSARLREEISLIEAYIAQARQLCLGSDSKAQALLEALNTGFVEMAKLGAAQKAIIFTESTRTQQHLTDFLQKNGYHGQIVLFNGSNSGAEANAIYRTWQANPDNQSRITSSTSADKRAALIDHFKYQAQIMIATEAAAEGVNLQFCSLLINYDLPWNPQRVEQRIGRCHRYGQKHDVVVMNFLNRRNEADRRVLELLTEKFQLFNGLFGASNDIIGRVENADLDFEKRVAAIYDTCRTPDEIKAAFDQLQSELESAIAERMAQTEQKIEQFFDSDVRERLSMRKAETRQRLDEVGRWFWRLSAYVLQDYAEKFDVEKHRFFLRTSPLPAVETGFYRINADKQDFPLRPHTPLGEWCMQTALALPAPPATVVFDYANHPDKISDMAAYQGKSGWLRLDKLSAKSTAQNVESLVFSAIDDDGTALDSDFCRHLFALASALKENKTPAAPEQLNTMAHAHIQQETLRQKGLGDVYIQETNQRLIRWEEDQLRELEREIDDAKQEERQEKRRNSTLIDSAEVLASNEKLESLRLKIRKLRRTLEEKEDDISTQRQQLMNTIRERMKQQTSAECLLLVRWQVT